MAAKVDKSVDRASVEDLGCCSSCHMLVVCEGFWSALMSSDLGVCWWCYRGSSPPTLLVSASIGTGTDGLGRLASGWQGGRRRPSVSVGCTFGCR